MRQPKHPRESTAQPHSRWLTSIFGRLNGPGGLYNLGNALGFGAGLLVAFLGTSESANSFSNVLSIGMRYVAGTPAAVALTIANSDLLLERGGLPSGLVERISARSEIDAARRSFVGLWSDRAWRGLIPARQSSPRRNFRGAACRWEVRKRFRRPRRTVVCGAQD